MIRWSLVILCSVLLLAITPVGVADAKDISYSNDLQFQGQSLTVSGDAIKNYTTYELWRVESFDDQHPSIVNNSTFIREEVPNSSGYLHISTVDLSPGAYFLRGDGLPYQPEQDDTFEVVVQDLNVEFDRTTIEPGLGTMLEFSSGRAQYMIDVSSPELNESDLITIFTEDGGFELATNQPAGSNIRLKSENTAEPAIFPSYLSDGIYTFEFDVPDTTTTRTESITIDKQSGVNVSITPSNSFVTSGDQTEMTVTLTGANRGVSGYKFNLSLSNTTFANISNIQLSGTSQDNKNNSVNITNSGATVDIDETSFTNIQSERLLQFDIDGKRAVSQLTINMSDITVQTDKNKNYSVSAVESAEVVIRDPDRVNTEAEDIVWKGQTAVESASHIKPDQTYTLRLATKFKNDQVSESVFVMQFYSSNGQLDIKTGSLDEGRYFIDGGEFDSTPNITDTFQVVTQTLDANFASNSVEHDGKSELMINSNRAQYDVIVSSDDINESTLIATFVTNGTFNLIDKFPGAENQIMVAIPSSETNIVDFNTLESGTHTFGIKTPVTSVDTNNVSIDVQKNKTDDDNGDGRTDDPGSDSEGSSGGSSGGGAGGSSGGSSGPVDTGPVSPEEVENTLNLIEPEDSATLDSDAPAASGTSVQDVGFENTEAQSVSVKDYGDPPETVEEDVIESIAADNEEIAAAVKRDAAESNAEGDSESESDGESGSSGDTDNTDGSSGSNTAGSGDSDGGDTDVDLVQLVKVKPEEGMSDKAQATVEFSVDREEVSDPDSLTVYKDAYVFEEQEEQWVEAKTTVQEVTDEAVEINAQIDEFSLFAVMEVDNSGTLNSNQKTATNETGQTDDGQSNDSALGFGVKIALAAIVLISMMIRGTRSL